MIDKAVLKEVLLDNQKEVEKQEIVPRNYEFLDFANYVLVGVRRAGKSFILYQQMQQMLRQGIGWDKMLYLNFEDDRLLGMTVADLNLILEVHGTMYQEERPILFLDEIQNIEGWHKFARRLADWKYRVYITGSNAKMLGNDVATTLGGRYFISHILPYSFKEYLLALHVPCGENDVYQTAGRAAIQHHFNTYFHFGGFPEGAALASKRDYLLSVYQKIYLGDIASRNKITNTFALRFLYRKLAESVMQPISFTRLSNSVTSTGAKISKNTLISYMEYTKDAYLIYAVKNFADNLTERETNPKYYFVDNGIMTLLALDVETALLENMVAVELLRRYGLDERVFFYNHNVEVDFYIPDEGIAIQVSHSPHKTEETWKRETSALIALNKRLDCKRLVILSYDEESIAEMSGTTIEVIPVWKWLISYLKS